MTLFGDKILLNYALYKGVSLKLSFLEHSESNLHPCLPRAREQALSLVLLPSHPFLLSSPERNFIPKLFVRLFKASGSRCLHLQ